MTQIIKPDGKIKYGLYDSPAGFINYQDYPLRDGFRDTLSPEEIEKRFVHFHFLGFASKRFISGCSLSYANRSKTVFFYLFDRKTGLTIKRGCRIGPDDIGNISLDPDTGTTRLNAKGMDVRFVFDKTASTKILEVTLDDQKVLHMTFSEAQPTFETLRLCTPTAENGWTYCQKVAGIEATGELVLEGQHYDLKENGAYAHHDFTAGFLRRDTFWNWACITGEDDAGNTLGLNLSNGVNETGFSENVIWLNGNREPAGLALFDYDLDDLTRPWSLSSDTGRVNLTFSSEGQYCAQNKTSSRPFDFSQLFGSFNGTVELKSGKVLRIDGTPGFCERQYAIWWD